MMASILARFSMQNSSNSATVGVAASAMVVAPSGVGSVPVVAVTVLAARAATSVLAATAASAEASNSMTVRAAAAVDPAAITVGFPVILAHAAVPAAVAIWAEPPWRGQAP